MTAAPALYRIAAASRLTGVAEHTLRVWDRRYGTLASHRTEAGYRLYTADDVDRIRRLRELVEAGHAIGDVAKLSFEALKSLAQPGAARAEMDRLAANEARRRFMAAVDAFDVIEAARILATARLAFSPPELVTEIIAPLLSELGKRWVENPDDAIAQEHAATVVLRDELMRLLLSAKRREDAPRVVVATPEGELHELGALIAAVVAAEAGALVLYLGPNLPARDLATAVAKHRADIVLLSLVGLSAKRSLAYLDQLRRTAGPHAKIVIGGAASKPSVRSGIVHVETLDDLRALITVT